MSIISDQEGIDNSLLKQYLELVYLHTGVTMTEAKKTLLEGRIRPRLKKLGLDSYGSYLDLVKTDKDEIQVFINLVTTHETSFFRTQRVWDYLSNDFLPKWMVENPDKTLKIWSAASSTGEEVYSICICCEEFRSRHANFNYQILGTDISTDVIARASRGVYSGRSIENFKKTNKSLFEKYLRQEGEVHHISDAIKSKTRFALHNLFEAPPAKSDFDIVFLRNVLIYFVRVDQERVINNIAKALAPNGQLIIGESESLNCIRTPFEFASPLIYVNSGKTCEQ